MYATYCSLCVALQYWNGSQEVTLLLLEAIEVTQKYHEIKYSIIWIESKASRKRVVKSELNYLAYEAYTLISKISLLMNYKNARSFQSVNYALIKLEEEHNNEINYRQLKIPLKIPFN